MPYVTRLENKELKDTLNRNLQAVFLDWLPEYFTYPYVNSTVAGLSSESYLSVKIVYTQHSRITTNTFICNTVDMTTGDILYLEDFVEVDEELVSLILTRGVAEFLTDWYGDGDYFYRQETLDDMNPEGILEELKRCSEPYEGGDKYQWADKPTFYLESGRLYLINVFEAEETFFIRLENIEDKLKVAKW